MFTIAGARKKIQSENRESSKPKQPPAPTSEVVSHSNVEAPTLFDTGFDSEQGIPAERYDDNSAPLYSPEQRDALKTVAAHLLELRDMLKSSRVQ